MSKDTFDQQLRQMFDGFEPEVPLGNFEGLKSELDNKDVQKELVRQTQVSRRLAIGATVVALGALGWTGWRLVEPTTEVVEGQGGHALEQTMAGFERVDQGSGAETAVLTLDRNQEVAIARTSTSVRIEETPQAAVDATVAGEEANEAGVLKGSRNETELDVSSDDGKAKASNVPSAEVRDDVDVLGGLSSSVQEACEGTEVSFTLGNGDFDGSVLWNFGDGNFSSEAQPTHIFQSPGTYDITISLRSRDDGMIRTRTVENMIVVRPKPDAELNWTASLSADGNGILVKYVDETIGSSSSTWLVDGHGLDRGEQNFSRSGKHAVHLVASNAYGCQDSQERIVEVGGRHEAKAPGLFSPDGDGRYDSFLPAIVSEVYGDWKLEVMDEKGKVVFETTDAAKPWNGDLAQGGKARSGGVYKWILTVNHKHKLPAFYFDTVRIER